MNINTLKNLDSGKMYFLSSTTGEVKEASLWMRMKCAMGDKSARQKVANLVDAVRTSLLNAAGSTQDEKLDTAINGISLTGMVKGSDLISIAGNFSKVNAQKIVKKMIRIRMITRLKFDFMNLLNLLKNVFEDSFIILHLFYTSAPDARIKIFS